MLNSPSQKRRQIQNEKREVAMKFPFEPPQIHNEVYNYENGEKLQLFVSPTVTEGFDVLNGTWSCKRRNYWGINVDFGSEDNGNETLISTGENAVELYRHVKSEISSHRDKKLLGEPIKFKSVKTEIVDGPLVGFYVQLEIVSDRGGSIAAVVNSVGRDKRSYLPLFEMEPSLLDTHYQVSLSRLTTARMTVQKEYAVMNLTIFSKTYDGFYVKLISTKSIPYIIRGEFDPRVETKKHTLKTKFHGQSKKAKFPQSRNIKAESKITESSPILSKKESNWCQYWEPSAKITVPQLTPDRDTRITLTLSEKELAHLNQGFPHYSPWEPASAWEPTFSTPPPDDVLSQFLTIPVDQVPVSSNWLLSPNTSFLSQNQLRLEN